MYKIAQTASVIFALVGTFLLAFGLKVRPSISEDVKRDLHLNNNKIDPSGINQRTSLVWWGLILISLAAATELYFIICS